MHIIIGIYRDSEDTLLALTFFDDYEESCEPILIMLASKCLSRHQERIYL